MLVMSLARSEQTYCRLESSAECSGALRTFAQRTGAQNPFDAIPAVWYGRSAHLDVDNDGDMDVIIGNRLTVLTYVENIGTPTKSKYVLREGNANPFSNFTYTAGPHVSVMPMDLDEDGNMDLIVSSESAGHIGKYGIKYLKNSNGTFVEWKVDPEFYSFFQTHSAGEFLGQHFIRPISFRGKVNLMVGDWNAGVKVFENIGGLPIQFQYLSKKDKTNPFRQFKAETQTNFMYAYDVDGDGDDDAIALGKGIQYLENTGSEINPSLTERSSAALDPFRAIREQLMSVTAVSLDVWDEDSDGDLDLVFGTKSSGLLFFESTTPAKLEYKSTKSTITNPFRFISKNSRRTPAALDIDNDGDIDFLCGNRNGQLSLLENVGFQTRPKYLEHFPDNNNTTNQPFGGMLTVDVGAYSAPTALDIDADSDIDILVLNSMGNITYLENVGNRSFPKFVSRLGTLNPFSTIRLAGDAKMSFSAVDIDGDFDIDLVVGAKSPSGQGFRYFQNTGNATHGIFTERTGNNNPFHGIKWTTCCSRKSAKQSFVDLDGDGDMDFFYTGGFGIFSYRENTGNKTHARFEAVASHPLSSFDLGSNIAFTIADIDSDGDPDFVVADAFISTLEPNICYSVSTCNGRGTCAFSAEEGFSKCSCFANEASGLQCQHCPAGKIEIAFTGGEALTNQRAIECVPCSAGRWSNISANLGGSCIMCPSGRFGNTFGAASEDSCKLCPRGFISNQIEPGKPFCLPCIPGGYQNEEGKTLCKQCAKNEKSENASSTLCEICPVGKQSEPGSAKCTKCDAGEAGTGTNGTCEACSVGRYRPTKDQNGTYTDPSKCITCGAGQYQDGKGQANW